MTTESVLLMVDVGIEPLRTIGTGDRYRPARVRWIAWEGFDYFPTPLTVASFRAGQSDYDASPDELYCPCGATLEWPDQMLGTAADIAEEHIAEAHR